ncbi:undecaprenyl-diphosphatase [Martelella alba]|uniref:Undecaprenyl-diphosphatase n=1 Tax=Martelella alba TaxID=2590451 RepID=A0ABY2ST24_9HYPH|nr:undecaprenyl-diphosphatase [Martelella alba]TKI08861.1 undecaprenyl-diphosphatase [Martelella alba]
MLESFNQSWFLSVNASSGTSAGVILFAKICAQYSLFVIPLIILKLWFFGNEQTRRQALSCVITSLFALGLGALCSHIYYHPRPFMIPIGHTWMAHAPDASFPSDHGTLFFSAAVALMLSRATIYGSVLLILSCFVAWSRVFLGVHFPFDMVGAVIIALLANMIIFPLWKVYGEPLTKFCESISYKFFFWFPFSQNAKSTEKKMNFH